MINRIAIYFFIPSCLVLSLYAATHVKATSYSDESQKSTGQNATPVQQNNAPVVKIVSPAYRSLLAWNTQVPYKISVVDKEDGDSKFEEITPTEVFLEMKYVKDSAGAVAKARQLAKNNPAGLGVIKTSNCLNCHAFNSKLIGPSFYDISKRYPGTVANIELLSKHVRDGSTGVWGNIVMPTHPELQPEQIKESIKWILKNAAQTDVAYYIGTEGSFRIKPSLTPKDKGYIVLTASYTDHGLKDKANTGLKGSDVSLIQVK